MKEIYLAGGCFWGTEKYLSLINGITSTFVGYANGKTENPSYQDVCKNNTGHAETVKVVYDENVISLSHLLTLFFDVINPVSINKQGEDEGTQYRTGIYYVDSADADTIKASIDELQKSYEEPIAIETIPLENFYSAEEYHQKYLDKNPSGYCHIGAIKFDKVRNANR